MNDTTITVVGNVANEPVLRATGTGTRVVSFRLASSSRRWDKALGDWSDGDTIFWTVKAWRGKASNIVDSLHKGDPVVVHGRIRDDSYDDKDGVRRSRVEIEAFALGHDLARGVTRFARRAAVPEVPEQPSPAGVAQSDVPAEGPVAAPA